MLDIGRGLRRNARIPAAEVRSFITAVDLTAEFWRVGALLNDQTQLANRVTGTPDGCPGGRGIGVGLSPTPRLPPKTSSCPRSSQPDSRRQVAKTAGHRAKVC